MVQSKDKGSEFGSQERTANGAVAFFHKSALALKLAVKGYV